MAGLSKSSQRIDAGQWWVRGVTCSPRPSQSARPPVKKNGTSEPSEAAMLSRSDVESGNCHHRLNAISIAAASQLLPPNPAAIGIILYYTIHTPCCNGDSCLFKTIDC